MSLFDLLFCSILNLNSALFWVCIMQVEAFDATEIIVNFCKFNGLLSSSQGGRKSASQVEITLEIVWSGNNGNLRYYTGS